MKDAPSLWTSNTSRSAAARIIAAIEEPAVIVRILTHLGLRDIAREQCG